MPDGVSRDLDDADLGPACEIPVAPQSMSDGLGAEADTEDGHISGHRISDQQRMLLDLRVLGCLVDTDGSAEDRNAAGTAEPGHWA